MGIAIVSIVGLILLAALALVGFSLARDGSLPGITVAGADVGGLTRPDLEDALREVWDARSAERLVFVRAESGAAPAVTKVTRGDDLGYHIDVDETSEQILAVGRQGNPVASLADHLRATFSTIEIEPVDSFVVDSDDPATTAMAQKLSSPPSFGTVVFDGTQVEPVYPEPGVVVSDLALIEAAIPAIREPGGDRVEIEGEPVDPPTTRDDVDALVAQAERAVDGPVTLSRGGGALRLSGKEIAELLVTKRSDGELTLAVATSRLESRLEGVADELETPPVDATFEASSGSVSIVPHREGFRLEPKTTSDQLLKVALRPGGATARLKGKTAPADFTTKDARALDIDEQVSTFTTYHSCCEPRVENIHRIADIVDGAIVEPGDSFSLNDFVGPRTTANGFVAAPAIRDGEFVEEVGGGISQFATTMFNAIFFGGYDFLEYQPHSYYISRYPPGREATISTPGPDLAFLNDSEAGVYIATSYTEESITVSFYGSQDFDVDAVEGKRKNVTPPKTQCREKESLAKGEESVVQEGLTGFDIVVTRVFGDGRPDEHFTTHYDMQPRIVERRKCR